MVSATVSPAGRPSDPDQTQGLFRLLDQEQTDAAFADAHTALKILNLFRSDPFTRASLLKHLATIAMTTAVAGLLLVQEDGTPLRMALTILLLLLIALHAAILLLRKRLFRFAIDRAVRRRILDTLRAGQALPKAPLPFGDAIVLTRDASGPAAGTTASAHRRIALLAALSSGETMQDWLDWLAKAGPVYLVSLDGHLIVLDDKGAAIAICPRASDSAR